MKVGRKTRMVSAWDTCGPSGCVPDPDGDGLPVWQPAVSRPRARCRRPAVAQAGAEVWRRRLALERTVGADQERSPIVAHLEVGDLLLWGSRTVHRSAASEKVPTTAAPQRCVSLVCMQPRAACPVGVLAKRKEAALRCITNNIGWTGGWTGGGPGVDRWVDAEKTERAPQIENPGKSFRQPRLTPAQLELVGYSAAVSTVIESSPLLCSHHLMLREISQRCLEMCCLLLCSALFCSVLVWCGVVCGVLFCSVLFCSVLCWCGAVCCSVLFHAMPQEIAGGAYPHTILPGNPPAGTARL